MDRNPPPADPTLDRRIKILYFIDHIDGPGGTERHLSYLATMLDPKRFKCAIVVFDLHPNALVDGLLAQGVELHHIPVGRYYVPNALAKAWAIARYIRENRIDIVQTYHYKSDIYASLIARVCGVKHIVSSKRDVADFKSAFNFRLHRMVRPLVERYIVVSEMVRDVIMCKEGAEQSRIVKIYNGVDTARFRLPSETQRAEAKRSLGFEPDDIIIGMVAWMRTEKDHGLLLSAFEQVRTKAKSAKLVLVGEGPLLETYRKWVAERNLENAVRFVGLTDDVRPYVAAFDIACLVPRSNEGFSNSVLEKMAMGLPMVVTDMGGNREAVAHGVNGFVIEPGALPALVDSLNELVSDPLKRKSMGLKSRERAESLFSLQAMIDGHQDLYSGLMAGEACIA